MILELNKGFLLVTQETKKSLPFLIQMAEKMLSATYWYYKTFSIK